jgi:hypothetical protein
MAFASDMKNKDFIQKLCRAVFTSDRLYDVESFVEDLNEHVYVKGSGLANVKFSEVPVIKNLEHEVLTKLYVLNTPDEKSGFIASLKKDLSQIRRVIFYVPFSPSEDFISSVYSAFAKISDRPFVIELHEDKSLINCAKLFLDGVMYELSIRTLVDTYLRKTDVAAQLN